MTVQSLLADTGMAGTWTLEPERSSVRFISKTLWGLAPVKGSFTAVTGEGRITPEGALSGRLVIRPESVRTGIGMRDRHLRAADFFDVERFPEIIVEVTAGSPVSDLATTLSIRGTTLPVPLASTVVRLDDSSVEITAHCDIDRTRWGVGGNMLGMMPPDTALQAKAVFTR